MKFVVLALTLFFSLLATAQKAQLLKGKWKFKDIDGKEKLDSSVVKEANIYFRTLELEFGSDGKGSYTSLPATWALNKEQTRVMMSVSNPMSPNDKKTIEWEIKGLTEKELKLNMGKAVIILDRPAPRTIYLDFYTNMAEAIIKNDLAGVQKVAESLRITGYTQKEEKNMNLFNPDPKREGENSILYLSKEKVSDRFPLIIKKFESAVQVTRNMTQQEVDATKAELKYGEKNKKGWKYLGTAGIWEYWEYKNIRLSIPGESSLIGGDCTIHKTPVK